MKVTIQALICLVDKKTGEKSKTRPRFIKQDQIAIARLEISQNDATGAATTGRMYAMVYSLAIEWVYLISLFGV